MNEKPTNPKGKKNFCPSGFSVPKLEEVVLGTQYTLTINIAASDGIFTIDHDELYRFCQVYLKGTAGVIFRLYPEYSRTGRLHLHGYIQFETERSVVRFYERIPRMMKECKMEIDTIGDIQKWTAYVTKQQRFIEPYCMSEKRIYEFTRDSVAPLETPKNKKPIEQWF